MQVKKIQAKKSRKTNILKIALLILVFITLYSSCVYATQDPIDGIFKVLKRYYPNSEEIVHEITKHDSNNYHLDIKKYSTLFDPMKKLAANTNQINNFLFAVNKGIAKITIFILLFAYKVDIFSMFSGHMEMFLDALKVPVYDQTLYVVIAGIGLYIIIVSTFANRKTAVLDTTIKTIAIVTIALIFMSNPSKYLTSTNNFSINVSDELFESTYGRYKNISNSDEALISAGKMIWDSMAHKPWQILVLGNTDDNTTTEKILSKSPYDEEREKIIKNLSENNSLLRLEGIPSRFFTLIFIIVLNIVISLIIMIMSSFSIAAQVYVVLFTTVSPFIFIIALIPRFSNILGSWGSKLLGYSMIKIIISTALSLLLILIAVIYLSVKENGILATLVIIAIVTFTLYNSRHQIKNIIKSISKGSRHVTRETRVTPGVKEKVTDYKEITKGYTKKKLTKTKNKVKKGINKIGKNKRHNENKKPSKNKKDNRTQRDRYNSMAKKYLEGRYNREKKKAENRANKVGTKVRYSKFVKDADMRVKIGEDKFTKAQINEYSNRFKKIEMSGEDPDKVLNENLDNKKSKQKLESKVEVKRQKPKSNKGEVPKEETKNNQGTKTQRDTKTNKERKANMDIKVNKDIKTNQENINTKVDKQVDNTANNKADNEKTSRLNNLIQVKTLTHKGEEILDELQRLSQYNNKSNNKNLETDGNIYEKMAEKISNNFNNEVSKGSSTQKIVIDIVSELNQHFQKKHSDHKGNTDNKKFFGNLVKKYGAEIVKTKLNNMKEQDNINDAKKLLITELKKDDKG